VKSHNAYNWWTGKKDMGFVLNSLSIEMKTASVYWMGTTSNTLHEFNPNHSPRRGYYYSYYTDKETMD
jgi:hypothetical protein